MVADAAIFLFYTMYNIYIIYSDTKDRYYVGKCTDLDERLRRHNTNHKGFTGKDKDWRVVYFENFDDPKLAGKREIEIKKMEK